MYIVEIPATAARIDPTAFDGCPDALPLCAPGGTAYTFAQDNGLAYLLLP